MTTRILSSTLATLALLACTGCGGVSLATRNTPQDLQDMQQSAASSRSSAKVSDAQHNATISQGGALTNYASSGGECNSRAQSRLAMYDRPDTYPISAQERHDAFLALYSSCMREHNFQVAGPVHSPANDASRLANLAPAAGGNHPATNTIKAGNAIVTTSSVPGGATVIVIGGNSNKDSASQLSSLSPSSGGSSSSPNATVVMVPQQQGSAAPVPSYAYAPAAPLPVAVPIPPPPVTRGYMPAATSAQPVAQTQAHYVARRAPVETMAQPSLAGAEGTVTAAQAPADVTPSSTKELENVLER